MANPTSLEPETTGDKQAETWFQPGQSGNPAGRPKGSRNKLGEVFIQALYADFVEHGVRVIETVRNEDPVAYMKVVAGILPKELKITDERDLTDDELIQRIRQLDALIQPFLGFEGTDEASGSAGVPALSN